MSLSSSSRTTGLWRRSSSRPSGGIPLFPRWLATRPRPRRAPSLLAMLASPFRHRWMTRPARS
eukprot:15433429-Alexandrium_andersonii.AAC.1